MVFCRSSGDLYLSLGISLSYLFVIDSELFCGELLETFVNLLEMFLLIKLPVSSAVFWIILFE